MEFREIVHKAREVRYKYRAQGKPWSAAEYTQALMGDVGDLAKLVMAKNGFRANDNIDKKLAHEISDCMWAIIAIADELGIDLETSFIKTMEELHTRLDK